MEATAEIQQPVVRRQVRKRDGATLQSFNIDKVVTAIRGAWNEVGGTDEARLKVIAESVAAMLPDSETLDVEKIQDSVEVALMHSKLFDVAKAYIVYRHKRAEARTARRHPDPLAVSEYIHAGKYARFNELARRRETYVETVARTEAMHLRRYGHIPGVAEKIRWAFDLVREKRLLPSMRSMQFGGAAIEAVHNRIYNCLGQETTFITQDGVKKFSDFKNGDTTTVLTHAGNWKKAKVKSYGKQQLFTYRFGRGGNKDYEVRATRDHTWVLEDGTRTRDLSVGHKLCKPPQFVGDWKYEESNPEQRTYWAMGYVYGDGTLVKGSEGEYRYSMVRLCGADKQRFLHRFTELGYATSSPPSFNGDAIAYTGHYLKTLPTVAEDGFDNVVAFVRGYLDADGHNNPNGEWPSPFDGIQTSSVESINFIRTMFPVVGAYITRERDLTGQETNFGIRPETSMFGLVLGFANAPVSPYIVREISESSSTETVWCLEVEGDHSFVLANGIVTGNCSATHLDRLDAFAEGFFLLLCGCGFGYSVQFEHIEKLPEFKRIDEKKVVHHVVEDSIEGWADALKALLNSYVEGHYVEFGFWKIRPEGASLRTSGGKAPGHLPLKRALNRIRAVLDDAQGGRLRPIQAHRIMCHAADAVLSGGIRRSAMICLFSLEDSEMVNAKTGAWGKHDPWFQNANNSVVLKRSEVKKAQFKRVFKMIRQWGEPGFFFVEDNDQVTNPCFAPDVRIATQKGYQRIIDLYATHQPIHVVIDARVIKGDRPTGKTFGTAIRPATPVALTKKEAPLFELVTEHGYKLRATDYHEFPTPSGRRQLKDLRPGDTLLLPSGEAGFGLNGTRDEGFMLGMYVGNGTQDDESAFLDVWEYDFTDLDSIKAAVNKVVGRIPSERGRDYGPIDWLEQTSDVPKKRIGGVRFKRWLTSLADGENFAMLKQRVPEHVWQGSRDFVLGYLQGLFYTDGSVQLGDHSTGATLSVRLTSVIKPLLEDVQVLLSMFGVVSRIYERRAAGAKLMPDGRGGLKEYECQTCYELIVSRPNAIKMKSVNALVGRKAELLSRYLDERGYDCRRPERYITSVASIREVGTSDVYCFTEPETNSAIANGIVTAQCGEISLNCRLKISHEVLRILKDRATRGKPMPPVKLGETYTGIAFCNLTEINGKMLTSLADFMEAAEAATIIGTCQAGYTEMAYLGWVSEVIAEREALLGVGITGMMDSPAIALNPEYQAKVAEHIVQVNADFAALIGVRPAARITCVKPSGTTSLELGCVGSGHHAHHARRYLRRVTANELEPVFQHFKAVNSHMCVRKPNGDWSIEFPVEAPEGAVLKEDMTAIDFLEKVKSTQLNWVATGTARPESSPGYVHNVSNTVQVKPEEWEPVSEYLWENREHFSGVTLISATGDKDYAFAPNEAIATESDEMRWNQLLAHYKPVDYTALIENEDTTDVQQEAACAGGACEIVR
jgi:intein/homing endonuclease